jgi:hypothetical protein
VSEDSEEVGVVRALIAQERPVDADPPEIAGWLRRVCRAAARELPAAGVGVSLVNEDGGLMTAAASGSTSALIEELQFIVGEGPCLDAYASRSPVLVPDLSEAAHTTWPGFAPAAREHHVGSLFSFPLQAGTARLGALTIYCQRAGDLSPEAISRARAFAEVAMGGLLDARSRDNQIHAETEDSVGLPYVVYQAQGMVMVQLGIPLADAMVRLRAHAFASGRRLAQVADDVIEHRVFVENDDP